MFSCLAAILICSLVLVSSVKREGLLGPFSLFSCFFILGVPIRGAFLATNPTLSSDAFWLVIAPQVASDLQWTVLILSIWFVFTAGVYRIFSSSDPKLSKPNRFFGFSTSTQGFRMSLVTILLVTGAYLFGLHKAFGNVGTALATLMKRAVTYESAVQYVNVLQVVMHASVSVALAQAWSSDQKRRKLISILFMTMSFAITFAAGMRGASAMFLLSVLFTVWLTSRRKSKFPIGYAAGIICAVAVIAGIGMQFRKAAQTSDGVPRSQPTADNSQILESALGAFPLIDLFLSAKNFSDHTGHNLLGQIEGYAVRIIPRSIWPNKPEILGMQIRYYYSGNTLSGAPPTTLGEFYIGLGWLGLFLGGIFWAAIMTHIRKIFIRSLENVTYIPLYTGLVCYVVFSCTRAGFEIGIFKFLYFLTGLYVSGVATRIRWNSRNPATHSEQRYKS